MADELPIGSAMCEYLANAVELARVAKEAELLRLHREVLNRQQDELRYRLEKSVDPICGSATKPHIRTFTSANFDTLSVVWDRDLDRGRISITRNEELS